MTNSPLASLMAVSMGKADAYIGNLAASSYLIEKNGLLNLKVAAPSNYVNYNLHFAVSRQRPELHGAINRALAEITPQEHARIRNKWLSIRYEHGLKKSDIVKWVSFVSLVAMIIICIGIFVNRRLKKEIVEREKAEKELKMALDNIKTLSGMLPICANCKKIRDDEGYWNQIESYIESNLDVLFTHGICPDCYKKLYGDMKWSKNKNNV